jgi:hypothetical protein
MVNFFFKYTKSKMEPTVLDANRNRRLKLKSGFADSQTTRQKALRLVGGGSGKHEIGWWRFFKPTTMDSVKEITNELYGWIIDLMVLFIEKTLLRAFKRFSPASFKYVMDVTYEPGQPIQLKHRYNPDVSFEDYASYAFVMTFVQSNKTEAVGLLYFEENDVEIFFPFPHAMKSNSFMKSQIEEVITYISRNWAHLKQRKLQPRWFRFQDSFPDSNIWVPYYLLLRQTESFQDTQKLFLSGNTVQYRLNEKCFFTYKRLGKFISECVHAAAKRGNVVAAGKDGAYNRFFSHQSKIPFTMDEARLVHMHEFFALCELASDDVNYALNDLQPLKNLVTNQQWPEFTNEEDKLKWKRFIPVKTAVSVVMYF